MAKKFFIFKSETSDELLPSLTLRAIYDGDVSDARALIDNASYPDGVYLCLHDTSGEMTKKTDTIVKSKVTFTPTQTKARKPKPAPNGNATKSPKKKGADTPPPPQV